MFIETPNDSLACFGAIGTGFGIVPFHSNSPKRQSQSLEILFGLLLGSGFFDIGVKASGKELVDFIPDASCIL